MKNFKFLLAILILAGNFLIFDLSPKPAQAIVVCDILTLDSPNGGETWNSGVSNNITWSIVDQGNPYNGIDVYYSTDSGATFPNLIVSNTANDGQYEWNTPTGINSSTVRIQVVGRQIPNVFCDQDAIAGTDQSDADFTISDPFANRKDTMTDSTINSDSEHNIEYGILSATNIVDGSMKVTFPAGFVLTGVAAGDVTVSGGDVTWGAETINAGTRTMVVPFTGTLNSADGKIDITFAGANLINNPPTVGEYRINVSTHTTADGTGTAIEDNPISVYITESVTVTATVPNSLTFTISPVASGQTVNSNTTTVASTAAAINFGTFTVAGSAIAAHDLLVSSNATNGFMVTTEANQTLTSAAPDTISHFTGTNTSPLSWSSPPGGGTEGYWGYTTEDTTLGTGTPNRFAGNLWAGHTTTPFEIFYHDGPTDSTGAGQGTTRIGYQLEITNNQPSGVYNSLVTYICTPTY